MYIVIYYVMGGNIEQGIVLNALNGTGFAIIGFLGIFVLRWLALRYGKTASNVSRIIANDIWRGFKVVYF